MKNENIDEGLIYVAELYRSALESMLANPSSANDHATLAPLFTNVEFKIAKEVIFELEKAYMAVNPTSLGYKLCLSLLASLGSRKAEKEDFVFILKNSSAVIIANILANPYFPLEMLLDTNIYESFREDKFFDYLIDTRTHAILVSRYEEAISYLKAIDPDVENMSAEMILSVLGVKI